MRLLYWIGFIIYMFFWVYLIKSACKARGVEDTFLFSIVAGIAIGLSWTLLETLIEYGLYYWRRFRAK